MTIKLNRLIEVRDALATAEKLLRSHSDVEPWLAIVRAHAFVQAEVTSAAQKVEVEVQQ